MYIIFVSCVLNKFCHSEFTMLPKKKERKEMYCSHDLEVMSLNPSWVKLGMLSRPTSVLSRT